MAHVVIEIAPGVTAADMTVLVPFRFGAKTDVIRVVLEQAFPNEPAPLPFDDFVTRVKAALKDVLGNEIKVRNAWSATSVGVRGFRVIAAPAR